MVQSICSGDADAMISAARPAEWPPKTKRWIQPVSRSMRPGMPFVTLEKTINARSDVQIAMVLANQTTLSHRGIRKTFEALPSLARPKPSLMSLMPTTGSTRETTS